ncbi:MAG: hypothetical protein WAK94_12240 [Steroidobacteraceae bacterium]
MAGAVRFSISDLARAHQCSLPPHIWILKVADRFAGLLEEELVVIDLPGEFEPGTQGELTIQNLQSSWAELDPPILTRFSRVLVDTGHTRFVDCQGARRGIEIRHD